MPGSFTSPALGYHPAYTREKWLGSFHYNRPGSAWHGKIFITLVRSSLNLCRFDMKFSQIAEEIIKEFQILVFYNRWCSRVMPGKHQ
jgi:hypothetical protein